MLHGTYTWSIQELCLPWRLQERPDLANLKSALVVSNAKMKAELAALEGRILGLLSASSGNILDDEELINTLAQAKVRRHAAVRGQHGCMIANRCLLWAGAGCQSMASGSSWSR